MTEFEFIDRLRGLFGGIGNGRIVGIGDDCAVIPLSALGDRGGGIPGDPTVGDGPAGDGPIGNGAASESGYVGGESVGKESAGDRAADGGEWAAVVTTDMLVEGVHFLRHATSARELGRKSLAVNLSDIAAMGARPVASFLSVALPGDCRGEWAEEFAAGYAEMSERHGVKPAGGDTASSLGPVVVSVTVIGCAPVGNLKYRSAARVGDVIAVAGELGASAAGLEEILSRESGVGSQEAQVDAISSCEQGMKHVAEQGRELGSRPPLGAAACVRADARDGVVRPTNPSSPVSEFVAIHNNPTPQVAEGQWFGGQGEVGAMMDLSDGLAGDLEHILRASAVGARVDVEAIPVAKLPYGTASTPVQGPLRVALGQAVAGGEDYKLLLTCRAEAWERLKSDFRARFGGELYAIGRIVGGEPRIEWLERGNPVAPDWHGFRHF